MQDFSNLRQRSNRATSSVVTKRQVSRFDWMCGLFSLVTSLFVFGASLILIAVLVYYKYSINWIFGCYVASSGWLLVMNVTSNVVLMSSKKKVRQNNRGTSRQTSVNLDLLNNPGSTRYLSYPPPDRVQQTNRLSESPCHTPPPSYDDVSKLSDENNESFSSGKATAQDSSLQSDRKERQGSLNVQLMSKRDCAKKYGQESRRHRGETRTSNKGGPKQDVRRIESNILVEKAVRELESEEARRILHKRIEDRRNQLDKRLRGDSLKKMDEYCMRDIKKETDKEVDSRQPPERVPRNEHLTPKESLRRNLKAKYGNSAENFKDIHSSSDEDRVTSVCQTRNYDRWEIPRVHNKSSLSLKLSNPDISSQRKSGLNNSILSLQDAHMSGSKGDIRSANEVGLPFDKTWKQKSLKVPSRPSTGPGRVLGSSFIKHSEGDGLKVPVRPSTGPSRVLDASFAMKHSEGDGRKRDGNSCGRSKSMPGRHTATDREMRRY